MDKKSNLLLIGVILLVLLGVYTGYLHFRKFNDEDRSAELKSQLSQYNGKLLQYESQDLLGAIAAKETLDGFTGEITKWSEVIAKILNTIPKAEDGGPLVKILSYSGSNGETLSLNVQTRQKAEKPYFDVADLIAAFDESNYFADTFVPSISSAKNDEGDEVLNFLLSTKYVKEDPLAVLDDEKNVELELAVSEVLEEVER